MDRFNALLSTYFDACIFQMNLHRAVIARFLYNWNFVVVRKCPNISWAQSRNSLLLTVDVKDAVDTADMLGWTDTTMFFRSVDSSALPFVTIVAEMFHRGSHHQKALSLV